MYLVCILQPNSADRIRPARLFAGSGADVSLVPSNYNCWRISVKQRWLLIRKRRQWNEENIVLNPDARPSYGLSTFNGNSARVGEEAAHWFLLCCQHRGVNAFFFFYLLPLTNNWWSHTGRRRRHSHFVIHRFALRKCLFFFCFLGSGWNICSLPHRRVEI